MSSDSHTFSLEDRPFSPVPAHLIFCHQHTLLTDTNAPIAMKVYALLLACASVASASFEFVRPEAPLAIPAQIRTQVDVVLPEAALSIPAEIIEAPRAKGIQVSRTVKSLNKIKGKVSLDTGCKSSDDYGSNDCELDWGSTYNVTYDLELDEDLDEKTILNVDLTLDGLIPFKASCAICGKDCTLTIPIIKKTVTIPFSKVDCPVKAGKLSGNVALALPANDPVPLTISVKGEATFTDGAGTQLGDLTVVGSVGK